MEYLLGVVVSLVVEGVKKYAGTSTLGTHLALLFVSLLGAFLWVYFQTFADLWPTLLTVLTVAAAFHNLVLRKF